MTSRVALSPVPPTPGPRRKHHPPRSSFDALHARYHLLDRVGAGCAGTVVHATDKASRADVAVKIVPKNLLVNKSSKMALAREVSVLSKLSHPHVVDFTNAFEDSAHVYIATEYCTNGDFYHFLKSKPSGLREHDALVYMRQILSALQYLHSCGISHRDVKPENVLIAANGDIKLADFGMCYWRRPGGDKTTREHCGTPQYAAPEILQRAPYVPEQGDMWACGIMLYAMLTRTLPFAAKDMTDLKRSIVNADPDHVVSASELSHVSRGTRKLLRALLSMRPSHRPSPTKALDMLADALLSTRRVTRSAR